MMKVYIVVIRDWMVNLVNTILSILRILLLSKLVKNIKVESKFQEVVILGNGPSLKDFLANQIPFLDNKLKICVNYFCRTEQFLTIKPEVYVIISPEYFEMEDKVEFAIERRATLQSIADKTDWPMYFLIPSLAKNYDHWKSIFLNHPFITIGYLNTSPLEGFNWFKYWGYQNNLGMPRPHNVLIPCVLTAINQNFKKIYIAGADHSWLKEIMVDDTNEVLLSQKHFYDKQASQQAQYRDMSVPQPMYVGATSQTRKLHEVIEKFYQTFRSYWVLESYARKKGVIVYNITPNSMIDAFERKTIN